MRTHPIVEYYQALRDSAPCLSRAATLPKGTKLGLGKRRAPGNTIILSQPYRRRVSTDRLNREGSQLAASLEGEPGPTPAGKTLPHSFPETSRFRRYITLNLVLGILPEFRGGVHIFLPAQHTIGSVPSLSGHAVAYRWRSLPRVRWHRASSPQGSSSNGCCPCITMDQMLLCSSLFPHPLLIYSENAQIIGCTKYTSIKILVLLL